jgi:hypothetical protein
MKTTTAADLSPGGYFLVRSVQWIGSMPASAYWTQDFIPDNDSPISFRRAWF